MDNILIFQIVLAFIYGFFNDFSDLLDEHGLKWFQGADVLTGILWAVAAAALMFSYPPIGAYLVGILLFWLVANKLDYFNHQLAAVIVLAAAFWRFQQNSLNLTWVLLSFGIIWALALLAKLIKKKSGKLKILHLRHFAAPLILSFLAGSPWPSLLHAFAMLGYYASGRWFNLFEKSQRLSWCKKLGFSITSASQ